MIQTLFATAVLLFCLTAVAQEPPPPPLPRGKASNSELNQRHFRIDFKIVQGKRLLERSFRRGSMISGFNPASDESPADGAEENVDLWTIGEHDPDATTLAEPEIVTIENRPAMFAVSNKKSFDYLVAEAGNRFRPEKTPPHELGLTVECTVRSVVGEPDVIELTPLKISQATLDGREPIAGLDLDVGKPIISKRSVETTARCVLGQARCVPIATTPDRQALLLVRVSRAVE